MNNIYFSELFKLAEDFDKFWNRRFYEVNVRGSRMYKNFNDYYQKHLESKKQEQEKYNNPDREISEERRKEIRAAITNEKTIKKAYRKFRGAYHGRGGQIWQPRPCFRRRRLSFRRDI